MRSRLHYLLGASWPWVLDPRRSALACGAGWLLTLPLTWQHPLLSLLGFVAVWGLTLAVCIEAPLLQTFPLPPLTVLLIGLCLRWGVGPLLMAVGGSGGDSFVEIWVRYGPQSQLLWLTVTSALLIAALPLRGDINRASKLHPQSTWLQEAINRPRLQNQLTALCCVFSIYMAAYIILSFLSGAFDRQFETYVRWTSQLWRLDTPVAAFSRIRDFWFLLFPLWWSLLRRPWRWILLVEICAFLASALLSGSRGLLFYPALLIFFGYWFVLANPRVLRSFAIFIALLVFVLSPIIYVVRDSPDFQRADSWSERIQSVGLVLMQPEPLLQKSRWLGRDLYACHDPYLFTPENKEQSLAGVRGLDSLLYLWAPKHLFPHRPTIFDGHLIAKQLQRVTPSTWSEVWFPCFSFPADLMRRWSVPGLLIGSFVLATFFRILFSLWYNTIYTSESTFHLLVVLLPATYLQSFPFGTVSETAWALLWELPKYLVLIWLLGVGVDRYLSRTKV